MKKEYYQGTEKLPASLEFTDCIISWYSDDGICIDRMDLSPGRNGHQHYAAHPLLICAYDPVQVCSRSDCGSLG